MKNIDYIRTCKQEDLARMLAIWIARAILLNTKVPEYKETVEWLIVRINNLLNAEKTEEDDEWLK